MEKDAKQVTEPSAVTPDAKPAVSSPATGEKISTTPVELGKTYYGRTQVAGQKQEPKEEEVSPDDDVKVEERLDKHPVYGKRFKKLISERKDYETKVRERDEKLESLTSEFEEIRNQLNSRQQVTQQPTQQPAQVPQQNLSPAMIEYARKLMTVNNLDEQTAIDVALSTQGLVNEVVEQSNMPIRERLDKEQREKIQRSTIENLNKFIEKTSDFSEFDKDMSKLYDGFSEHTKIAVSTEPNLPVLLYKAAKYDRMALNSKPDNFESKPVTRDADDDEETLKNKIFSDPKEWAKYRQQLKDSGVIRD